MTFLVKHRIRIKVRLKNNLAAIVIEIRWGNGWHKITVNRMSNQEHTREELDELRISVARRQYEYLLQKQDYELAELTYYTNKALQAVKEHGKLLRQLNMLPEICDNTTLSKHSYEEKEKQLKEEIKEYESQKAKTQGLLNYTNNNIGAILKLIESALQKKKKKEEACQPQQEENGKAEKQAAIVTPTKEKNKRDTTPKELMIGQKSDNNKRPKNNESDCSNAE